jgi:hypothetical protein
MNEALPISLTDLRKNFITKEEYCADLSKGVLLTNSVCAWAEGQGNYITLKKPYTDFRFLRVDYTGSVMDIAGTNVIDVALFTQLMTTSHIERGVGTAIRSYACAVYNLCGDAADPSWFIWTSNSCVNAFSAEKSTPTKLTYSSGTGLIIGIWGFK